MRAAISKILYQSYRAGKRYGEGKAEPESYNRTTDKKLEEEFKFCTFQPTILARSRHLAKARKAKKSTEWKGLVQEPTTTDSSTSELATKCCGPCSSLACHRRSALLLYSRRQVAFTEG
ncbi:hypothetical protein ETH_00002195 [Eimeria tenella]|uniref:Uncharacterized protein n=1 Tax=Eimeria tenella TaxID=5802 RepID=U6L680_EIMTE|nr:hypothetical protein ETH_00002195 [Eimeria tenella]CDJ43305.1 hypothetical protein ETH_00002195 [Eimeria tenella]|eukprot:XP_013234055.1 hypothetical protein ETH_00002195 [Eimeria tenella]